MTTKKSDKPKFVVTTQYRGMSFGTLESRTGDEVTLSDARDIAEKDETMELNTDIERVTKRTLDRIRGDELEWGQLWGLMWLGIEARKLGLTLVDSQAVSKRIDEIRRDWLK